MKIKDPSKLKCEWCWKQANYLREQQSKTELCDCGCKCVVPSGDGQLCKCLICEKIKTIIKFDTRRTDDEYVKHKKRLKEVATVIDNRAPKILVENLLRPRKAIEDYQRIKEMIIENHEILRRLNVIDRTTGLSVNYNVKGGIRVSKFEQIMYRIKKTELANVDIFKRIIGKGPTISNTYLKKCWAANKEEIQRKSKFPLILPGLINDGISCMDQYRPKVFFDFITSHGMKLGRLHLVLYSDLLPNTVKNFLKLVDNYRLVKKAQIYCKAKKCNHYGECPVHRIFLDLYLECGDITHGTGIGGISATGEDIPEEKHVVRAKYTGMIAMIPVNGMINSKFCITFKPLEILNDKRVFFGRVLKGFETLRSIEAHGHSHGKPREPIKISNCGVYPKVEVPPNCICKYR